MLPCQAMSHRKFFHGRLVLQWLHPMRTAPKLHAHAPPYHPRASDQVSSTSTKMQSRQEKMKRMCKIWHWTCWKHVDFDRGRRVE